MRLLVSWPLRLTERLVLELLQLGIARAMRALQFQVLAYCLVENAHLAGPLGEAKAYAVILALARVVGRSSHPPPSGL